MSLLNPKASVCLLTHQPQTIHVANLLLHRHTQMPARHTQQILYFSLGPTQSHVVFRKYVKGKQGSNIFPLLINMAF